MIYERYFYIQIWNNEFDFEELMEQYDNDKFKPIKSVHYEVIKCKVLSKSIDWENDECEPLTILLDLEPITKLPSWFDKDEYECIFNEVNSTTIYYNESDPHPFHWHYLISSVNDKISIKYDR